MKLTCECCKIEQEFADERAAFDAGWDAPPYFTEYVCCDLCPSVALMGLLDHSAAHERWEREGRPKTFNEQFEKGDIPQL
jgi:hypothetical protein